ncbi:MAG: aldose 1-epimerase [Candidatus Azotimanducaceae bacterium]
MFHLENDLLELQVSNYGARLISLRYKPLNQQLILGQWSLANYLQDLSCFGAVVGRTCNRIENAQFELDGVQYHLEANEAPNHLHGGSEGFQNRCWAAEVEANALIFTIESCDGEGGYPGNVVASVRITLEGGQVGYEYHAVVDRPTYVDLTNHAYFSLDNTGSILDHELMIAAQRFAAIDEALIPTGSLKNVDQSPFDFRVPRTLQSGIEQHDPQLKLGNGYDHSYLLDSDLLKSRSQGGDRLDKTMQPAATLYSSKSRIEMQLFTTAPAVQLYTGNFLDKPNSALCLETQHLPNACNQHGFEAPLTTPVEPYFSRTDFCFRMRES